MTLPVQPKLLRRFSEAVKFEEALKMTCEKDPENLGKVPPNTDIDIIEGAEVAYRSFVNKLAHVCDIRRGGTTVTGITILQDFDCIRYLIGSNERKSSALSSTSDFVGSLFRILRDGQLDASTENSVHFFDSVLQYIIRFNQPRIRMYLGWLPGHITDCLPSLKSERGDSGNRAATKDLREALIELQRHAELVRETEYDNESARIHSHSEIIKCIYRMHTRARGEAMFKESRENTINPSKPWLQLRHTLARLRAYHVSARSLISAQACWPSLFEDVRITMVPSSTPHPNPLAKSKPATAAEMIGRMVSPEEAPLRWAEAEKLQQFDLDSILKSACALESFTPIVHAEVLVHDAARTYIADNPGVTYWNNWAYVGSSKPTCRLCSYYFSRINDVAVRETHGNLYSKWRAPDVFDAEGDKRRRDILNYMTGMIRKDALQTLRSKLPQGANNDSSSFPTVAAYFAGNPTGVSISVHGLAGSLASLRLGGSTAGIEDENPQEHRDLPRKLLQQDAIVRRAVDDSEDDGGGVLVFRGRWAQQGLAVGS